MKIELRPVAIKDIYEGFEDNGDEGVYGYGGKLAIRPPYQREFVYDIKQERAVIDTIIQGFPLNAMYWVKTGEDQYEVLDGQQRTLSVMYFLEHQFVINYKGLVYAEDGLPRDILEKILKYEFMIYVCDGTNSEKIDWFRVVNIAGEKLTDQELRNSAYTGPWLEDAKRYFSKRGCVAKSKANGFIKGDPIRQELLEKALIGICEFQGETAIEEYMAKHQHDPDANELWQYFQDVIDWATKLFSKSKEKNKDGLDWCHLYNQYHNNMYNSSNLQKEVAELLQDDEVQKKRGIYQYLLAKYAHEPEPNAEKYLQLRTFSNSDKDTMYHRQNGICPICHNHFEIQEMEADHVIPWSRGGRTELDNCQMLCKRCNREKSNK